MVYSNDDIKELYLDIDRITKFDNTVTSLEELEKRLRKEVNFQDKCEGDNLLGDLLLKHATENNNLRVKDFLLQNGCEPLQQEQITAAINKEEEVPNVEENKADSNEVDSSNSGDTQFAMSYNKIKEIVINNPDITAGKFNEELKKEKIDTKITNQDGWTLLYYAVRQEGFSIISDRSIFLKIVELFTNLNIGIDFKDTASRTVLGTAAINKQADVVEILLNSGKFNEEEKFNALRLAIIQGNVQEIGAFLGYVKYADALKVLNALETSISDKKQVEIIRQFFSCNKNLTEEEKIQVLSDAVMGYNIPQVKLFLEHMVGIPETSKKNLLKIMKESQSSLQKEFKIDSQSTVDRNNPDHNRYISTHAIIVLLESAITEKEEEPKISNIEENGAKPCSSNGNIGNKPTATVSPILTKKTNPTTVPNSGNGGSVSNKPVSPVVLTNARTPAMSSGNDKSSNLTNAQFSRPNEKETKYKENFYTSLTKDAVGVVITGLFIAAAVMVPFAAGAAICGIVAALVAVCTGLHIKNSTLPSYREMEKIKLNT